MAKAGGRFLPLRGWKNGDTWESTVEGDRGARVNESRSKQRPRHAAKQSRPGSL